LRHNIGHMEMKYIFLVHFRHEQTINLRLTPLDFEAKLKYFTKKTYKNLYRAPKHITDTEYGPHGF
jgi:hypothetical protein